MKGRGKMSRRASKRQFAKGTKIHVKNLERAPARGGIRL